MYLNTPIPHFYCYARKQFFYNLEKHQNEYVRVMVFGIASVPGRAIGWHVMTDFGAVFWRLPIHALCSQPNTPPEKLDNLQLWDCYGEKVSVTEFPALKGLKTKAKFKDGTVHDGEYMFTVDWWDNPYSDTPEQNKCAHILALKSGNYAALPNNRILWAEASFVEKPFETKPDFIRNTYVWRCE